MPRIDVIETLLEWMESHLDELHTIDTIAIKSGYSKWHLQRMFKEFVGMNLATYMRTRRLSQSAVELRLTSRSILDIAHQYNFDSQQTFTRAFKAQFGVTPGWYRQTDNWYTQGMQAPFKINKIPFPDYEFVRLKSKELTGITTVYHCSLKEISVKREHVRSGFWMQLLNNIERVPTIVYGLHKIEPRKNSFEEQDVFYSSGISTEEMGKVLYGQDAITLQGGEYIKFVYVGERTGFHNFILHLYHTCIPQLGLIRRRGQDIERFITLSPIWTKKLPDRIHCEYFIPIKFSGDIAKKLMR